MTEHYDPITTAAIKQARASLAALVLELPESVWTPHKGAVENAIAQMVEELGAVAAERDQLRAALVALNAVRDEVVRTQHATWSNTVYPLVAILDEAGFASTVTDAELDALHGSRAALAPEAGAVAQRRKP